MDEKQPKIKRRKAWNEFGHSHFLTFSTFRRHPYLVDDRICELLAERINQACAELNFAVLSYVFMPDHVHLLVHPLEETYSVSKLLQAIKQGPSRAAKNRGLIETELWEPGGGFDRNIFNPKVRKHTIDYIHLNPVRKEIVEESWSYFWSSAKWYHTGEVGIITCHHLDFVLNNL